MYLMCLMPNHRQFNDVFKKDFLILCFYVGFLQNSKAIPLSKHNTD